MPRLLVCGSRTWTDGETIHRWLVQHRVGRGWTVLHGDARGADRLAAATAEALGAHVVAYPAEWDTHGVAAGPIRNQRMLDEGEPTHVVAFWDGVSSGTADMVRRCQRAGLPVIRVAPCRE